MMLISFVFLFAFNSCQYFVTGDLIKTPQANNNQPPAIGGKQPINLSDPKIQEIAQFSVVELNKVSNAANKKELIRIVSAEKQVVAGILHHLKLELKRFSTCKKDAPPTPECSQQSNVARETCEVTVLDTLSNERKLQKYKCTPIVGSSIRTKRNNNQPPAPGGNQQVNLSDPKIQKIAQFSVVELNKVSNAANQKELIRIISAERQVVAGILHHLKLELKRFSTCKKDAPPTPECSQQSNVARETCEVTVLDTLSNERKLQKYKCTPIVGTTN